MASRYKGPLRAYRIADARHPLFSGGGAAEFGGRWNSPGRLVIYGALSYAEALLEKLVQSGMGKIPSRQHWMEIRVPDAVDIEEISETDVPGWDAPDWIASRSYGDHWLEERRTVVLVVPAVVGRPHERNIVINQHHPDFRLLTASEHKPVNWDPRLGTTPATRSSETQR